MAVLNILTAPHPALERRARDVEEDEFGPQLARLVSDMAETMYAAPGVGLAAPQVGDARRIMVVDPGEKENRGRRFFGMINPIIQERSQDTIPWGETCLSVPDFEVEIQRSRRVRVTWRDPNGAPMDGWFEDYESVIVQHELDHLEGTILLDRASLFKRSRYLKKVKSKARDRVPVGG